MLRMTFCVALAFSLVVLLQSSKAQGAGKKTYFEGTETNLIPAEGGTWITDGATFFIVMGAHSHNWDEMTDSRVTGDLVCWTSGIVDLPEFAGPMWGPYHLENDYGAWDGYWMGAQGQTDGPFVRSVGVGSGKYEGLIACTEYWQNGDGPLVARGYIIEAKGGPGDRPIKVTGSRVDQLTIHFGMKVPPSDEPGLGVIGTVDILSGVSISSHLGLLTEDGVGVIDPITGAVSSLGFCIAANGDLLYWIAEGNTNLGTGIFDGHVSFLGGTGRFEAAVGGFKSTMEETPDPDDPTLFRFDYAAKGTIRY